MKKWICILIASLTALACISCAPSAPRQTSGTPSKPASAPTSSAGSSSTASKNEEDSVKVEETVLVDQDGIKITLKGIDMEGSFLGPELKLLIENNTEQDFIVQARNSSINGYMIETTISEEVAVGKKSNTGLTFSKSNMKACGIKTIADMEFSFHIFTKEGWDTILDTEQITVKTSAADGFNYQYNDSGETIYEADGIKIVSKGLSDKDSIFGPGLVLYIENSSEKDVTVQVRDESINGFMMDTIFSEDVLSGKRSIDAITFMNSSLEENGIDKIESIEFSFSISAMGDFMDSTKSDIINLTF